MAQEPSNGTPVIVASIILGLSIVTGSFMMKTAVDEGAARMGAVLGEMQALTAKLAAAPAAAKPAARAARPGRPDPAKVYQVAVGTAPTKGPKSAKVKIIEWSDFQ